MNLSLLLFWDYWFKRGKKKKKHSAKQVGVIEDFYLFVCLFSFVPPVVSIYFILGVFAKLDAKAQHFSSPPKKALNGQQNFPDI